MAAARSNRSSISGHSRFFETARGKLTRTSYRCDALVRSRSRMPTAHYGWKADVRHAAAVRLGELALDLELAAEFDHTIDR